MKHSLWALLVLLFVVGVAIGFRFGLGGDDVAPAPTDTGIACTMEARECPDGSYVGRSGPKCEFAVCPNTRSVQLFYYDAQRDKDASGNLLCSAQGLVAVTRYMPVTKTPIGDTIRLLLRGELTSAETARGISTEYPLSGFTLVSASLPDDVLTLTFRDLGNKTTGGSCRVGILWAQIEKTALQFPEVKTVRFMPEELFQP